jgi:hypothetical protein
MAPQLKKLGQLYSEKKAGAGLLWDDPGFGGDFLSCRITKRAIDECKGRYFE